MKSKTVAKLLIATTVAGACGAAIAATSTATMTNTATVANNCTIDSSGYTTTYDPIVAQKTSHQDVTASVTTTCTNGAAVKVTLSQGANANTGSTDAAPLRRLSSGGTTPSYLTYSLFQDSARTTVWGNTADTGVSLTGTGSAVSSTVYARINSGQNTAKAGSYTDTVTATVTF